MADKTERELKILTHNAAKTNLGAIWDREETTEKTNETEKNQANTARWQANSFSQSADSFCDSVIQTTIRDQEEIYDGM